MFLWFLISKFRDKDVIVVLFPHIDIYVWKEPLIRLYGKKIICVRFLKNISTCLNKYRQLKKLYRKFRNKVFKFILHTKTYSRFYNYNENKQIICTVLLNHLLRDNSNNENLSPCGLSLIKYVTQCQIISSEVTSNYVCF